MNNFTTKRGFVPVPENEASNIGQSPDDILLRPQAARGGPLAYNGAQPEDVNVSFNRPTSRPRYAPAHHFWKNPFGLGTVIFIGDVILTAAPCLFLILAFQALSVNGKSISSHGQTVEQAAKLGPTLFPIIFAAIVGRLMRVFALWKCERGSTLGILEQLNGSQNLLAALERAVLLPGLGIMGFGVVLLWMLSPVGGQSSLRVINRSSDTTLGTTSIYYFNNTGNDAYGAFGSSSGFSAYQRSLNAMFQASLLSIQRTKGTDVWGNIKIPYLQYMPSYVAGQNQDGWYTFSENNYTLPYSAHTGIVISGLKPGVDTNFTMESSYFNLTCTEPRFFNMNRSADYNTTEFYGGFIEWAGDLFSRNNLTAGIFNPTLSTSSVSWNSYFVDTNFNYSINSSVQYNVVYASQGGDVENITAYNCSMGVTHVESDILCKGSSCQVRRLRPSQKVIGTWWGSGYPFITQSMTQRTNLLSWLSTATSMTSSATISPIDWYVSGSDTPFQLTLNGGSSDVNYHNVTGLEVAQRLGSLINTGWQLSFQLAATGQTPSTNETALAIGYNSSGDGVGYDTVHTTATTSIGKEIFVANRVWVGITLVVAFILLLCGVAAMVFKYWTRSPDILGYVSSMTRDNPSFQRFPGDDKLDGLERARVMRNVQVQLTDVRPWDEDGHITLSNLGFKRR
ncbi:hypothetical protein H2198_003471 [Neophaeococcomyces mojaviensis]|uniref:Uncharacterized protein n=1 Tax=Neophaeococcomyces mojaviensis TaxID=3383035 RepID=A0ACC3ABG2_9EURO|nr:hypothetical protein H2198_003471 [Knufia sp. JES_112]